MVRFIPASAGNTRNTEQNQDRIAVHPRERGEHWGIGAMEFRAAGSSPRARGTQQVLGY